MSAVAITFRKKEHFSKIDFDLKGESGPSFAETRIVLWLDLGAQGMHEMTDLSLGEAGHLAAGLQSAAELLASNLLHLPVDGEVWE